jgi:hypothetical protein
VPLSVAPVVVIEVAALVVAVGASTYVKRVLEELIPLGVVTITLAVPALPAGVVQVAEVAETTTKDEHVALSIVIPVAPVRLLPVIVIGDPPEVGPNVG